MSKTKAELEAGVGDVAVFLMEYDSDDNLFNPRFTFNDVKEAVFAGKVAFLKGSFAVGSDWCFVFEPVMTVLENGASYQVATANTTFEATAPDVLMQNGGLS